jgi:hypothetical protein
MEQVILISALVFLGWHLSTSGKDKARRKHYLKYIKEDDLDKPARHIIEKTLNSRIEDCDYREKSYREHWFRGKNREIIKVEINPRSKQIKSIYRDRSHVNKGLEPNKPLKKLKKGERLPIFDYAEGLAEYTDLEPGDFSDFMSTDFLENEITKKRKARYNEDYRYKDTNKKGKRVWWKIKDE